MYKRTKNVFLLITILFLLFTINFIYIFFYHPYLKKDTFFIVNSGENYKTIIQNLYKQEILQENWHTLIFRIIYKIFYQNKINIQTGEYFLKKNFTLFDIFTSLKDNKIFYRKVTFSEGLTNNSILKIIDSTYGLVGDLPKEDELMEGTLLPETYFYTFGENKKDFIKRMQNAMNEFINNEWESRDINLPFKTKQELLSLASIVEKETGLSEERKIVASVFINRLKKHMRLESDPTVIYSITKGNKDLEKQLTKKDLKIMSKYNTYVIYGIPKFPISNPGKDTILATLHPANTNYLYFVATGNGGHNFSKTYSEHRKYVQQYRKVQIDKNSHH